MGTNDPLLNEAEFPLLYKSTTTSLRSLPLVGFSAGSSIPKGRVDADARSIMNALVNLSYMALSGVPGGGHKLYR